MPVFPKRRFQHGSVSAGQAARLFPQNEARYRRHFETLFARRQRAERVAVV
jgi:asparagine synthase (glutamine-hydrolysing)